MFGKSQGCSPRCLSDVASHDLFESVCELSGCSNGIHHILNQVGELTLFIAIGQRYFCYSL
jgi:hypothetical protein